MTTATEDFKDHTVTELKQKIAPPPKDGFQLTFATGQSGLLRKTITRVEGKVVSSQDTPPSIYSFSIQPFEGNTKSLDKLLVAFTDYSITGKTCLISGTPRKEVQSEIQNSSSIKFFRRRSDILFWDAKDKSLSIKTPFVSMDFDLNPKDNKETAITEAFNEEYKKAYNDCALTQGIIFNQVDALLSQVLGEDITHKDHKYIVRLSSSWGLDDLPNMAIHIHFILNESISNGVLGTLAEVNKLIDGTLYKSPVNFLNLSSPEFIDVKDPIDYRGKDIKRVFMSKGTKALPSEALLESHPDRMSLLNEKGITPEYLCLDDETNGPVYLCNKHAESSDSPYSVEAQLIKHYGYIHGVSTQNEKRYHHPESSDLTGAGSLIHYRKTGVWIDKSNTSKLLKLLGPKADSGFTAYDFNEARAKKLGNREEFISGLIILIKNDKEYQQRQEDHYSKIIEALPSETDTLSKAKEYYASIERIVGNYSIDTLPINLKSQIERKLKDRIKKYKTIEGAFKPTCPDIDRWSKTITQDYRKSQGKYDPSQSEEYNTSIWFNKNRESGIDILGENLIMTGVNGALAASISLTSNRGQDSLRIIAHKLRKQNDSGEDFGAQYVIRVAHQIQDDMIAVYQGFSKDDRIKSVRPKLEYYLFDKSERRGINAETGEISELKDSYCCMKRLPFTEEEYNKRRDNSFKDTFFYERYIEAFAYKEDRLESLRNLGTHILIGNKPSEVAYALVGASGSGKSTVINKIFRGLLEDNVSSNNRNAFVNITLSGRSGSEFFFQDVTSQTEAIVINEANIGTPTSDKIRNEFTSLESKMMAATGGDTLSTEQKGAQSKKRETNFAWIFISNTDPYFTAQATERRLLLIPFDVGFTYHVEKDNTKEIMSEQEFVSKLKTEYVEIFQWLITNPRLVETKGIINLEKYVSEDLIVRKEIALRSSQARMKLSPFTELFNTIFESCPRDPRDKDNAYSKVEIVAVLKAQAKLRGRDLEEEYENNFEDGKLNKLINTGLMKQGGLFPNLEQLPCMTVPTLKQSSIRLKRMGASESLDKSMKQSWVGIKYINEDILDTFVEVQDDRVNDFDEYVNDSPTSN